VPDEQDDHLVPPPKVMRKRLGGVYRADSGLSGPTRRYVLIVALLVGLASIPTLAAITAGSNELSNGKTDTMDVPFLPPTSPGPVRTRPWDGSGSRSIGTSPSPSPSRSAASPSPSPSSSLDSSALGPSVPGPSALPSASAPATLPPPVQGASEGAEASIRAGRILGQVGERTDQPGPPHRDEHSVTPSSSKPSGSGSSHNQAPSHAGIRHSGSKHSTGSSRAPALSGSLSQGGFPSVPGFPALPGFNAPVKGDSTRPSGDDSSGSSDDQSSSSSDDHSSDDHSSDDGSDDDGSGPGDDDFHHHGRDFGRHAQCDDSTHRAYWAHHRTIHIDRSSGRSGQRRRSAVTERPQNARPAHVLERSYTNAGHLSRRAIPEARSPESRAEDNQLANRSYRGNHRLAGQHHADRPTPAQQRGSRVGRHHADQQDATFNG
jgi:hypothetical protein